MKRLHILLMIFFIAIFILIFPVPIGEKEPEIEGIDKELDTKEPITDLSDTYPEYPTTLDDCENTSKKSFCIGDVAEITNNISLCYEIDDPEIKIFCIARISMDENLCMKIGEEGLKGACLESIDLKRSWENQ